MLLSNRMRTCGSVAARWALVVGPFIRPNREPPCRVRGPCGALNIEHRAFNIERRRPFRFFLRPSTFDVQCSRVRCRMHSRQAFTRRVYRMCTLRPFSVSSVALRCLGTPDARRKKPRAYGGPPGGVGTPDVGVVRGLRGISIFGRLYPLAFTRLVMAEWRYTSSHRYCREQVRVFVKSFIRRIRQTAPRHEPRSASAGRR